MTRILVKEELLFKGKRQKEGKRYGPSNVCLDDDVFYADYHPLTTEHLKNGEASRDYSLTADLFDGREVSVLDLDKY